MRSTRQTRGVPVASGNAQAVSILSPEEAAILGGLPGPAVAGFLGGDPPSFEAFRPNRALVAGSYVPNPQIACSRGSAWCNCRRSSDGTW